MEQRALPKGKDFEFDYSNQKRLYGYLHAILMSFYSVNIYVDIRHRWKGFGILYMLLLMGLLCMPLSIYFGVKGNSFFNNVLMPSLEKLPRLNIEKGVLHVQEKSPYIIHSPETNKPFIIIDTSGAITDLPNKKYPDASILFTRFAMITKYAKTPVDVSTYGKELSGIVDKSSLKPFFLYMKKTFLYTLYPNLVMLCFGVYYSIIAVFAFIMKMFSKIIMKYHINYKQALRLVCVSSTPVIIFFIPIFFLGYSEIYYVKWTMFAMYWGYYIFAIRSNKFAARYPLVL